MDIISELQAAAERRRNALLEDLEEREERSQEDQSSGLLDFLSTVGLAGGVAYGLGVLGRTDAVLRVAGAVHRSIFNFAKPLRATARAGMEAMAEVQRSEVRQFTDFELLGKVRSAIHALDVQAPAQGATPQAIADLAVNAAQRRLRAMGFGAPAREGLEELTPLTVGDVLSGPARFRGAFDPAAIADLQRARELGVIADDLTLTRGYGGLFRDAATGEVVDTRFLKPANILAGLEKLGQNFQIPFVGFRPMDLISAPVRRFGEGEFAGMVGSDLQITKSVRTGEGLNFVFGGELWSHTGQGTHLRKIAENIRLRPRDAVGELGHLTRYGAGKGLYSRELDERIQNGTASFLERVQHRLGMGAAYRSRPHAVRSIVLDPIARHTKGVIWRNPNIPAREALDYPGRTREYMRAVRAGRKPGPELARAHPQDMNVPLSRWERIKAVFGVSKKAIYIDKQAAGRLGPGEFPKVDDLVKPGGGILPEDLLGGPPRSRVLGGMRSAWPNEPIPPRFAGRHPYDLPSGELPKVPIEHIAYQGKGGGISGWLAGQAEALVDIGHYMMNRVNDLASYTLGMGFRPSEGRGIIGGIGGFFKNYAKIKGLVLAGQAGIESLQYADYLFESTVGQLLPKEWDSPRDWGIQLYKGARYLQTGVRTVTGVRGAAEYSEDLMPGSIDSGLSFLARTVGPVVGGLIKGGGRGAMFGAGVAALVGGTEPQKTLSDLSAEFSGEKLVAVRQGRWWLAGRAPFEGGAIEYFKPHWTKEKLSDYKYTDVLYGSKAEYWSKVSRLPTLHNFLGFGMLFQEGGPIGGGDLHLAKKHKMTRPYPDTPGIDENRAEIMAQYIAARGPYDAPLAAGQRLGYGTAGKNSDPLRKYTGILGRIAAMSDEITELSGIYKFLLWDLPGGSAGEAPKLASYETINSSARSFYDENLGGMLGLSELWRRIVSADEGRQGVNPVPNISPEWLPGSRSEFVGDRQHHVDYHLGDPFSKITKGEMRLPGAGYEALHRLHSGTPGVYDPVDRLLILGDVAPNSEAYDHYKLIVDSWKRSGVLDAYWIGKIEQSNLQVKQKLERYKFYERKFTGIITDKNPELTAQKYNPLERAVGSVYEIMAHDIVPKFGDAVPILGSLVADKMFPIRSSVEHYQRFQIYGDEFANWRTPYQGFVRPRAHWLTAQDPLTAVAGGAALGLMGANPVAAGLLAVAGGVGFGAASSLRAMGTGQITGGYIPEYRKREMEMDEYTQALAYTKGRMMESRALAMKDTELAYYYDRMSKRTTFGMDWDALPNTFAAQAMRSMTRTERAYFPSFLEMPHQAQNEVMKYMSPTKAAMLAKASGRWDEPAFARFREMTKGDADERVASYFQSVGGMPGPTAGVWHPDVPMDAVKIKMLDTSWNSVAADIHRFDMFAEHRYRATKFDNIRLPEVSNLSYGRMNSSGMRLMESLRDAGFQNVDFRHGIGGPDPEIYWEARNDPWYSIQDLVRRAVG